MVEPLSYDQSNKINSRYALVMAAAKRARQLQEGAEKLVECEGDNPITIALKEIAVGKIKVIIPTQEEIEAAARAISRERDRAPDLVEMLRTATPEEETPPVLSGLSQTPPTEGVQSMSTTLSGKGTEGEDEGATTVSEKGDTELELSDSTDELKSEELESSEVAEEDEESSNFGTTDDEYEEEFGTLANEEGLSDEDEKDTLLDENDAYGESESDTRI